VGTTVYYIESPQVTKVFTETSSGSGVYVASYFVRDVLSKTSGVFTLVDPRGGRKFFDSSGKLTGTKGPGDTVTTTVGYDGSNRIASILTTLTGIGTRRYVYGRATGSRVTSITYEVDSHPVLKTEYEYDSTLRNLVTVKTFENSASGTGEDWGTDPIRASRYTYHPNGLLRHVITPEVYQQMEVNNLSPGTTTNMTVLNEYADTEYEYHPDGRVKFLYTRGRRYVNEYNYTAGSIPGSTYNTWRIKTEIKRPGEVVESVYLNGVGQIILRRIQQMSGSTVVATWYPVFQKFQTDGGARIILSADASTIDAASFSETKASLIDLYTNQGKVEEYVYDVNGMRSYVLLRRGTTGTANRIREWTYDTRTVSGAGTVRPVATEVVYPVEGSLSAPITTSYQYDWHSGTLQPSKVTTTLPAVPQSQNGTGVATTTKRHFDLEGYLAKEVDGTGMVTTYEYDKLRGGLVKKIVDEGSGKLNLTTDYVLDDRGRKTLEQGPAHTIDISGAATSIRSAAWTYYKDREGKTISFRGYQTLAVTPLSQIVGPVTVTEPNIEPPSGYSGWRQSSQYDAVYTGTSGIPSPSDTYAQSSWVRWKIGLADKSGEIKEEWSYFDIPTGSGVVYGAQSTNYGKKLFAYDSVGRLNQTTCAGGTIDKTTFNAMGWAVAEELGTSVGLSVVEAKQYDPSGNPIKKTMPVDSNTANDRVTDYRYDWRNRLDESETTVENGFGGTWKLIEKTAYDNRDLPVSKTGYHTSVSNSNRTSYGTTSYDMLGRPFQTQTYGVNSSGVHSNPQTSKVYYDARGQVVRDAPSGSALFTSTAYDAVGRPSKTFQAYEPSGFTPGSNPASVANAVVMEQREFAWDDGGNLLGSITRLRFDTATGNGELKDPGNAPEARASYVASYPDALGRVIATADYGAKASATWTRPSTVPARSDDTLVNSTTYDAAGNATVTNDPADIATTRAYDNSDRIVSLVENAAGSVPAKRTTHYEYTDDGWLRKLKCDNATTGQQVTEWVYGVTDGGGSFINSNRLVRSKYYPDTTGAPDWEGFGYNRQQEMVFKGNQAGTNHVYNYDKLGRLYFDGVVGYGTGIDTSVYGLGATYNERGLVSRRTTYATSGVLNQVTYVYNDFNQLVTEYQEHAGSVNASTSPKVQYTYENGSANTTRSTGITYPDGTVITTAYTSAQAGFLSRPDQIKEISTVLAGMRHLGLRTLVGQKYDAASNTEFTCEDGGTGDAGDKYTGLDRFGRLVETLWKNSSDTKVRSKYGRNRVGDVVWRRDEKAHALSVITQDNFYWYDGLQQVTRHDRGNLTPTGGPPPYTGIDPTTRQQQEDFTYDETGNWPEYQSMSPSLVQTRTHNKANEISSIPDPAGTAQPVHDPAGNMTTMPTPADWTKAYACKWDPWNRLVEIKEGSTVVSSFKYDAATRRIEKTSDEGTRSYFYNQQWRSMEERLGGSAVAQYTWNPNDRWNLIRRKRSAGGTLNETHFVLRDYLDPVAIINPSGTVEERYGYDAFGPIRVMEEDFDPRSTSSYAWSWLFHGEFADRENSLYNYGYRYYHPQLGRWLSRDPAGESEGTNLYCFLRNEPLINIDIFGGNVQRPGGEIIGYRCQVRVSMTVSCACKPFTQIEGPCPGSKKIGAAGSARDAEEDMACTYAMAEASQKMQDMADDYCGTNGADSPCELDVTSLTTAKQDESTITPILAQPGSRPIEFPKIPN
jgi:RHS repeat-associated protein